MDSFKLLEDVANMARSLFSLAIILDLLFRHNLGYSTWGWRGIAIRALDNTLIFTNEEEKNKAVQRFLGYKSAIPISGEMPKFSLVTADDPGVKPIFLHTVQTLCENAEGFLMACRETGRVSFDFINEKFATIQKRNPILLFTGSIERPTLSLINIPIPYATLEDEIETKAYLIPFLAGEGLKWTRSRDCEECGRLFFYKLERARYCSQACRMRANHKARKEK